MNHETPANLERALGRLEGKVDVLLEHTSALVLQEERLTRRLSRLELQMAYIYGGAAAVAAFFSAVISFFVQWINK